MAEPARGAALARFRNRLAASVLVGAFVLVLGTVGAAVLLTARGVPPWGPWSAVGAVCTSATVLLRFILGYYYPPPGRRGPTP